MSVMRCPICGAKMKYGVCEYCQIKAGQVSNASNKAAKKAFRTGKDKDKVHYSSTLPSDVNKVKLALLTVLLGYAGAGYFYVGKYARAWSFSVAWVVTFIVEGTRLYLVDQGIDSGPLTKNVSWFLTFLCALTLIVWLSDIIGLIFKKYNVPVILAEDKKEGQSSSGKKSASKKRQK